MRCRPSPASQFPSAKYRFRRKTIAPSPAQRPAIRTGDTVSHEKMVAVWCRRRSGSSDNPSPTFRSARRSTPPPDRELLLALPPLSRAHDESRFCLRNQKSAEGHIHRWRSHKSCPVSSVQKRVRGNRLLAVSRAASLRGFVPENGSDRLRLDRLLAPSARQPGGFHVRRWALRRIPM